MFFGLVAVDDHPCCRMQEIVEAFFLNSIVTDAFSLDLFPEWMRPTLRNPHCSLKEKFSKVHALLHDETMNEEVRRATYEQLRLTNRIEELCDGTAGPPTNVINWDSDLGKSVTALMESLYESLDLVVFRRNGQVGQPTHQFYSEFIEKNRYVCPFCGLDKFKNRRGARREDFDHYLHKSDYPLAAANMRNLVPTCGTCNQDYKKAQDILADGSSFYPYAAIPKVKLAIDCTSYPAIHNLTDPGNWSVTLELVTPDATATPKIKAWNRVYSIKKRLEHEIQEFHHDWMTDVSDDLPHTIDGHEFEQLIDSARAKAKESAKRRMQPGQILKEAFYDFMLRKADSAFVESFRRLRNEPYT